MDEALRRKALVESILARAQAIQNHMNQVDGTCHFSLQYSAQTYLDVHNPALNRR